MEKESTQDHSHPGHTSLEYKPKPIDSDESFDEESGVGGSGSTCSLGLMKDEKTQKVKEVGSADVISQYEIESTNPYQYPFGVPSELHGNVGDKNHLSQHTLDSESLNQYPISDASNGTPKRSKIPVKLGSTVKPRSGSGEFQEGRPEPSEASASDILDRMASDISSQVLADAVSEVENEEALQTAIGQISSDFVTGQLSISQCQKSDDDVSPRSEISEPTTTSGISGDKNNMYHICEPWSDQDGAGTWSTGSSAVQTPRDALKENEKDPVCAAAVIRTVSATPKVLPKKYFAPSESRQVLETPQSMYPDSICFTANQSRIEATPGQHVPVVTSTPFVAAGMQLDLRDLRRKLEGLDDSIQADDMSTFTGAQVVPDCNDGDGREVETDEETIKDEEEVEAVITKAGVQDYMPADEREKLMTQLGVQPREPDQDELEPSAAYSMYRNELERDLEEIRHGPRPQPVGTDADSDSTSYRAPPLASKLISDDPLRRTAMSIEQPTGRIVHTEAPRVRILNDPDTIPQRESDVSEAELRRTPTVTDDTGISVDGDIRRGECSDTSYHDLPESLFNTVTPIPDESARSVINTSLGDTIITEIEDFLARQSKTKEQHYSDNSDENADDIHDDSIAARVRELLQKCERERSFTDESNSTVVPSMVSDVSVSPSPKRDGPRGDAFDTEVTPDITSSGVTSDDVDRYGQSLGLNLHLDDRPLTNRSEDSLSEKVHRLLQNTAYLGDDMSPRASPRSIHELIHSIHVHDESLDYEQLQRELDYIERSLDEKEISPQSRMSQASSCRSTGTSASDEGDRSKRLAWDYGADIGEGNLPQFVASVKNPKDDLIQAINNLTAIEEERQHRRARSVSPNPEERQYTPNLSQLRGRARTESDLAMEQRAPSLTGLLTDRYSLAHKVWQLLEKESPQEQAYEYLREAEETEYMIHLRAMQAARLDEDDVRRYDDRHEPMRESYESYRSLPGSRSASSSRLHQHQDLYRPHSVASIARSDSRLSADQYHREIRERYSDQRRDLSPERRSDSRGRTPSDLHRPHSSTSLHHPNSSADERLSPTLSRHASTPSLTLTSPARRDARSDYESSMSPMAKKPFHAFSHATDFLSIQLDKMQHQRFDVSPKWRSRESVQGAPYSPTTSPKKSPTRQPKMGMAVNRSYLRRDQSGNDTHDASREVAQFTAEVRQRDIRRRLTPKDGRYLMYGATSDDSKPPRFSSSEDQADEMRELARGRMFSTTEEVESSDLDSTPRDLSSAARRREEGQGRPRLSARDGDGHHEDAGTLSMGETTMESTHTGSDDAEGPYIPRHLLGSRPDFPVRNAGIYANPNRAKSLEKVDEASKGSLIEIRAPSEYSEENPQYRRPAWQEEEKKEDTAEQTRPVVEKTEVTHVTDPRDEMVDLRVSKSRSSEPTYDRREPLSNEERARPSYGGLDRVSTYEGDQGAASNTDRRLVEDDITLEDLSGPTVGNEFEPLEPTVSATSSDREEPPLRTAGLKPRPALKILQDILEGESDGSDSLPPNLNDIWERYRHAKRDEKAAQKTRKTRERLGLLADLLRNPTHHLVRRMEEDNDLCQYEQKLKEKFGDDYERILSERRQAWQQKEGRRSRDGGSADGKRMASPGARSLSSGTGLAKSKQPQDCRESKDFDSPRSEETTSDQARSELEADLSRTLRRSRDGPIDDSTPRSSSTDTEMRAKMATILDQTDSLSSIPEGDIFRHPSTDATTSFEIDKIPLAKLDPKYVKLQQKIRDQKEKYAKEKRRELKRKEKIVKLERILHDKKTGKEVSITDSSSVTTVSSLMISDTISDSSAEDTTTSALKSVTVSPSLRTESPGTFHHWNKKIRDANLSSASDSSFCPCKENVNPVTVHQTEQHGRNRSRDTRGKKAVYLEFAKPEKREPWKVRPSRSRSSENRKKVEKERKTQDAPRRNKKVQIKPPSPKPKRSTKTRDQAKSYSAPKFPTAAHQRLVSMATQTSPRLFEGYAGLEEKSVDEKVKRADSEPKVPHSRIYSPEKMFEERKKHKPSPKGSVGGMAWYVPIKDPKQPWRLPLKERQAHLLRQESEPWQATYPAPAEDKDPMEGVEVAPDTEFCLGKPEDKEESKKRMTLQEALLLFRQDFISHSRERERRIYLAARERMMRYAHDEQREKLFKHTKTKQANLDAHPLSDLWFRPQKRVMSKKEMRELTEKIYQKLPEVTDKIEVKKREAEYKTNRLRAEIYKRKQLEKVLGRY
ncbi:uncharacterized protein LOC135489095 [Lineus longissimus]|uniref:uncharacterized protein LOC135489095 n=1 Tax=Lineus longissimus TaxID=88925 RepID=UPI002B4D498F